MSLLKGYSMIAFGGGACVLPFLNLFGGSYKGIALTSPPASIPQTVVSSATTHNPPSATDSVREEQRSPLRKTEQIEEKDNCQFTAKKEGGLDFELGGSYSNYISFNCNNRGQNDEIITANWTIWIPKVLLKGRQDTFEEGQRVNIKTASFRADLDSYENETKFDSSIFSKSPIKGTWGEFKDIVGTSEEDEEAFIYKVTITSPDESKDNLLYLKWK